ncbi:MAG TPA: ATP synthase F1 subunit epsilon [Polyangiaceae bacterium]|nr:ATP synthase F1 subunit epsilon [Polyangiaceae bacterium]
MAGSIALEIITPDGPKLKEAVDELTAPSVEGEFGVLPMHRPMLAALATGIVTFIQGGKSQSVAVGPGFVEVANDKALLLTDRFIKKEDIDPVRTRLELKEVDEKLDHFKGDPTSAEYAELVERELWAAAQLELHGDPPPARIRNVSSLGAQEDYSKTATAEDDGTSLEDTEKH